MEIQTVPLHIGKTMDYEIDNNNPWEEVEEKLWERLDSNYLILWILWDDCPKNPK